MTGAAAAQQSVLPTITFEFNFPGSDPEHYVISVASDCQAVYESNGKLTAQAEADDSYHYNFAVTAANCSRIFELAKRAHYFEGEIDLKRKNLASTGTKTLSYRDSAKSTKASYNYSSVAAVSELTDLFQRLGPTLEFGHRLEYEHRYQKLALDEDLKSLQQSLQSKQVEEISAIAPILKKIVDDASLMNVIRARAQQLLAAGDN